MDQHRRGALRTRRRPGPPGGRAEQIADQGRIGGNEEFTWLLSDISEFNEHAEEKSVSLLESVGRQELKEAEEKQAQRKAQRETGGPLLAADDILAESIDPETGEYPDTEDAEAAAEEKRRRAPTCCCVRPPALSRTWWCWSPTSICWSGSSRNSAPSHTTIPSCGAAVGAASAASRLFPAIPIRG
jgi:hypothetical protein